MGVKGLLAGMSVLAASTLASADVIVSSLGSPQSNTAGRIGLYYVHSAQFTTDGSAYTLTSVDALIKSNATTHAWIYADNGGLPGTPLFELEPSAGTSGQYGTATFLAGDVFQLEPDTVYHLVLSAPDDTAAEWAVAIPGAERFEGPGTAERAREYSINDGRDWRHDFSMMLMYGVNGQVPCPGDFNGDGNVNTLDVISFLNAWSTGDADGDFNGDGTNNTLDVLGFLNAWSSGC